MQISSSPSHLLESSQDLKSVKAVNAKLKNICTSIPALNEAEVSNKRYKWLFYNILLANNNPYISSLEQGNKL